MKIRKKGAFRLPFRIEKLMFILCPMRNKKREEIPPFKLQFLCCVD